MRLHTLAIFLLPAISIPAPAQVTLTAPASVKAGAPVQIGYGGSTDKRAFITIVSPDTPKGKYTAYKYLSSGNPVELRAPEVPGAYEVRLLEGGSGYPTLATRPIVVEVVQVSLNAASQVDAGADVQINWQGPNNQQDYITIVPVGTPEKRYEAYKYTKSGNPVTIRAPETAGDYEIRYLSGGGYLTWASRPLTVGAVSAALEASPQVAAGGKLQIKWSGPDNDRDFITIVAAGAPERKYNHYRYTSSGNPVELAVPDEPGQYEIRYLTGSDYLTLASRSLTVGDVSASVDGPAEVQGGTNFEITWTGPDNPRDFVTIVEKSRPEREYGNYAYTNRGSPLTLRAPLEPGDYELRYSMGASYRTLASKPIRVTPPASQPGTLRVVAADAVSGSAASPAGGAIEVILDASGSMLQRQDGERRIDIAKRTLTKLTAETIPAGTPFALRVFGHKQADSCRTDLEIPMKPLDPAAAAAMINGIQAMNLAKTPIADSLAKTAQDLAGATGERTVVLVTDGEETCDGDPAAAIEQLKKAGVDVRVNIVGFAIDDADLKGQFRYWANVGGGEYFDAASAAELAGQLTQALRAPFEVVNAGGEVVAEGIVGGDAVAVPAGGYSLRTKGDRTQSAVEVKPGEETVAKL